MTVPQLQGFGSLIYYQDEQGRNICLGDLIEFPGKGVYEPSLGRVEVPPDQVDAHNRALDKAMLTSMDANCEVGQGSYAYYDNLKGVTSFIGTVICPRLYCERTASSVTFRRAGKVYRGRLSKAGESFNFKRIS